MGFLASFLGYLACLCTAMVVIVASVAHILPAPPTPPAPQAGVEIGAQKKKKKSEPRGTMARNAQRARATAPQR